MLGIAADVVIVRYHQQCSAHFFVKIQQNLHHFLPGYRVQIAGGLVGNHQLRIIGKRAGNRDPLPLAAGKLGQLVIGAVDHIHLRQQFHGPAAAYRLRYLLEDHRQLHIFPRPQVI